MTAIRSQLLEGLARLAQSNSLESRLLLEAGPVYLLWIAQRGREEIVHECVASSALPARFKLSSERGKLMRELGFAKRGGRRNWRRSHTRDSIDLEQSTDEALDILMRIYGVDEGEHAPSVALHQDEREHPENPALISAMRVVSKGFDEDTRRAMYTAMLNATFLVPLGEDEDAEGSEAFLNLDDSHPSGRPTVGAFTDWQSLRLWAPRGHSYWPIHGSDLFEMVMERKPVSMRINPDADVGGELYAHEVEMLVRAVHSFRKRRSN